MYKKEIAFKWRVTDLGEPSKIIGIKIMHSDDSISILQKPTPMDHNHLPKPNPNHKNTIEVTHT